MIINSNLIDFKWKFIDFKWKFTVYLNFLDHDSINSEGRSILEHFVKKPYNVNFKVLTNGLFFGQSMIQSVFLTMKINISRNS